MAVDQPHDLGGEFLPLVLGRGEADRKAALESACDGALDAAELVEVGHNALACVDVDGRHQRHSAHRDITELAGVTPARRRA